MNEMQTIAAHHPCRLVAEMLHPRFKHTAGKWFYILTASTGEDCIYENYGGSVWHVSVSNVTGKRSVSAFRAKAIKALRGVGDSEHEWHQENINGRGVYHLRRRMTDAEQKRIGSPVDIRGTPEAERRCKVTAAALGLSVETVMLLASPP